MIMVKMSTVVTRSLYIGVISVELKSPLGLTHVNGGIPESTVDKNEVTIGTHLSSLSLSHTFYHSHTLCHTHSHILCAQRPELAFFQTLGSP